MSKRKQEKDSDEEDSDISFIDVDFDFFDPNPEVDYQALKRLLVQQFQTDAEIFHLHEFTELILSQPQVGTTVKTDGQESDPYAFLTVLNMNVHHDHPSIKAVAEYALQKSTTNPLFHTALQLLITPSILAQNTTQVGFVFCERLYNMPVQVIPPMYRLLQEELQSAAEEGQQFNFTHLLFISRIYHLSPEENAALQTRQSSSPKKSKRKRQAAQADAPTNSDPPKDGVYSFHPEDSVIMECATHTVTYAFTHNAGPREKDAFGLEMGGRMMLVSAEKLPAMVKKMAEVYAVV